MPCRRAAPLLPSLAHPTTPLSSLHPQVKELEGNLTDVQLKEQEVVQENVREATTKVANLNQKVRGFGVWGRG